MKNFVYFCRVFLKNVEMVDVQFWTVIPFIVMLLLIAVAPLAVPEFWERNLNKLYVTLALAVPTAVLLICMGLGENLLHQILFDYVPFIILLMSLFVVTGGILIKGDIMATPKVNAGILALGFGLASFIGTTGAAMLLIRPLLNTNSQRNYKVHTVLFFIALVANCGGVLTPLGDPPLFLLYLRGASFAWFFKLFPQWLLAGGILLFLYYIIDTYYYRKEPLSAKKRDVEEYQPIRIKGALNFVYVLMIIASVIFLNEGYIPVMGEPDCPVYLRFLREYVLVAVILLSMFTTHKTIRSQNKFSWDPILEVAILFVGIFTTMTPALLFLNSHAASFGLDRPWQFFYATGALSSFLDNAPTAVAFHTVASGLPPVDGASMAAGVQEAFLRAVALGAVFFGSMTYIGNGPNFMVKSIAEQSGVRMPSFFGYMLKFSLCILLPVYVIVQLVFLH